MAWYENRGGQFALPTRNAAYLGMVDLRARQVLEFGALNRGVVGDSDVEIVTLELLLEANLGDPLSGIEAGALFSKLSVYLDDGDGDFDGGDTEIASVTDFSGLTAGQHTFAFSDGDPNVQLVAGSPSLYFVVVTLQGAASAASPNQFVISHLTESSSTAEDGALDLPLTLEYQTNQASVVVGVLPALGDFDGDDCRFALTCNSISPSPSTAPSWSSSVFDSTVTNMLRSRAA